MSTHDFSMIYIFHSADQSSCSSSDERRSMTCGNRRKRPNKLSWFRYIFCTVFVPFWLFFDVFSVTTNRTILWEMSFLCILWSWKMLVKVLRKHLWVQWVKLFGCHRQQKKKNFHQWIKLKQVSNNSWSSERSMDQKPLGSVVCTRP